MMLYWLVVIFLLAILLTSVGYSMSEAIFVASMFLPGAFTMRFVKSKFSSSSKREKILDIIYIISGILIGELLLIITANYILRHNRNIMYPGEFIPDIVINPIFIALILTILCIGDSMLWQFLKNKFRPTETAVRFNSNRTPVTLRTKEILYVESNDSETWVYATDGEKYRNKTPISHWENLLEEEFVRIHRSYLVNREAITEITTECVYVGEVSLPISRKYKDSLTEELA